jgi:cell division protein FtsZ
MITSAADPDANIIWGAALTDTLEDEMDITVIATGFDSKDGAQLKTDAASASGKSINSGAFSAAKAAHAAETASGAAQAKPAGAAHTSAADDEYLDIMSIFKRKN